MINVNNHFEENLTTPPLLAHPAGCLVGNFIRRQKRFSVAVRLNGEETWIHSNNSGSMLGLMRAEIPTLLSPAQNPKRKLAFTQEAVWMPQHWQAPSFAQKHSSPPCYPLSSDPAEYTQGFWVGVNTSVPNKLLEAAFHAGLLPFASGYTQCKREAKRGQSRLDACLTGQDLPPLWVECKNVTMVEDDVAMFPDAATERGQKHLMELMDIVRNGERAAMFYLVQRADGHCFAPAEVIDPAYAALFWQALEVGVEAYPMRAIVSAQGIHLGEAIPIIKK